MKDLIAPNPDYLLIAVEPVTLHRVHLSIEGDKPLCGTPSVTGFECVGDVAQNGASHLNSCRRCLSISQGTVHAQRNTV